MKSTNPQVIERAPNPDGSYNISKQRYDNLKKAEVRASSLYKEQLDYQRDHGLRLNDMRIVQKLREIEYKQIQINTGKLTETHADFKDGVKPIFFLKNDIDFLEFEMKDIREQIKKIKEEQEKDANSS